MVRLILARSNLSALVGFFVGLYFLSWLTHLNSKEPFEPCNEKIVSKEKTKTKDGLVFVGVMTAAKYLDSRAVAVYDTWGRSVPGKMMFFSSEHSKTNAKIPVVPLAGVDDSYPPQKKSFLMLKYMHDHFIDDYEWFMRADDDVYVRTDRLGKFLRSVDSNKVQFLGQAGVGRQDEKLSLGSRDNYCMGGPGMFFSRYTLRKVVPHIEECLRNLYSSHEDVEVGRCIRKFTNITCTWAYEMQHLFHHYRGQDDAFGGRLRSAEVLRAITLHPLKATSKMYKVHNFYKTVLIQDLNHQLLKLKQDVAEMKLLIDGDAMVNSECPRPSLTNYLPEKLSDIVAWTMFDQTVYSDLFENPHFKMENYLKMGVYDNVLDLLLHTQKYNKQRGRTITFKNLLYGYYRVNPLYGLDYVFDILLTYQRYKGRKITLKVRRHAYIRQSLISPTVREIENSSKKRINFILPLSGRLETFLRFMQNFVDIALKKDGNVELMIVLFLMNDEVDGFYLKTVENLLNDVNNVYPKRVVLHKVKDRFSRGLALNIGASLFSSDSLLTFLDVDVSFKANFLLRIRQNTVINYSAYFPIIYSQYNPKYMPGDKKIDDVFFIDSDVGYWRMYGYGIASIFKIDFERASKFNENIVGWGLEDVDFVKKVMESNMTIFRSADPSVVHVFHEPSCDPSISKVQYNMCLGTKFSTLGSMRIMSEKVRKVIDFNDDGAVS